MERDEELQAKRAACALEEILKNPPKRAEVTEESIRVGQAILERMREREAVELAASIERGDLITRAKLQRRLQLPDATLDAALEAGQLFALPGPDGLDYFPAFFVDPTYADRDLARVAVILRDLPASVRYHFFLSPSFRLQSTPLEALAEGRIDEVLSTATGFVER